MPTEKRFSLEFGPTDRRISQDIYDQLVNSAKMRTIKRGTKYPTGSFELESLVKKSGDYATNINR